MSEQARAYKLRRWAKALRETNAMQIVGELANGYGGRCSNGVFMDDLVSDGIVPADWVSTGGVTGGAEAYAADVGRELDLVPFWNDEERLTFSQIADRLDAEADRSIDPVVRLIDQREHALALLP